MATKIKTGTSVCSLQDILFPVEIRDEDMWAMKDLSKRVVGIIDGKEKLLNQMSNVYELIPNANIFPEIENILTEKKISFSAEYQHKDHARFYANYVINNDKFIYKMKGTTGKTDEIRPMIRIRHSYNGLTKYAIVLGYYRLVCTNGLTIPVEEMKQFNFDIVGKHTNSIVASFDKLRSALTYFSDHAQTVTLAITGAYENLGGRYIADPEERLKVVLEATKINVVENNKFNTINSIMEVIQNESHLYGNKVNDWLIYNGINQYIHNDSRNIMTPEIRADKDSKVLEFMLQNS